MQLLCLFLVSLKRETSKAINCIVRDKALHYAGLLKNKRIFYKMFNIFHFHFRLMFTESMNFVPAPLYYLKSFHADFINLNEKVAQKSVVRSRR